MRVFKATYRDRDKNKKKSEKWYVEFRDCQNKVRRIPAFKDKKSSEEFGRKIDKLVNCKAVGENPGKELVNWLSNLPSKTIWKFEKYGLINSSLQERNKPLAEHLENWREYLTGKGNCPAHIKEEVARIKTLADACKFLYIHEIQAAKLQKVLLDYKNRLDWSHRTYNSYLGALKSFCNWAVLEGVLSESPLIHLKKLNEQTDRRRPRRAATVEEIINLFQATYHSKPVRGIPGPERALIYRVAIETGLRANEIRTLKKSSFSLDIKPYLVHLEAKNTKNRKAATLPIREESAVLIRDHLSSKHPEALAFKVPDKTAQMLREDLKRAGIPYWKAGKVLDFHALRGTCGTLLAREGVHLTTSQKLLRHSDPKLTANFYTHTLLEDKQEAVERLPSFSPQPDSGVQSKTGTEDGSCLAALLAQIDPTASDKGRLKTKIKGKSNEEGDVPKTPPIDPMEPEDGVLDGVPKRIRTADLLSHSQALNSPKYLTNKELTESMDAVLASCLPTLNQISPELASIVEAWPELPEHIQKAIMALVDTRRRE